MNKVEEKNANKIIRSFMLDGPSSEKKPNSSPSYTADMDSMDKVLKKLDISRVTIYRCDEFGGEESWVAEIKGEFFDNLCPPSGSGPTKRAALINACLDAIKKR